MPNIDLMGATYPDVPAVTLPSGATTATFYYPDEIDYASSPSSGGNANRANAILYGTVDSTSTATVFTATVEGLTELVDGTTVMLHNGVVTSASGFTVNVNGLGAKKCYNNMTNATQDTTIFNASYTMLFVYSTALDSGSGGWWIYRGYDANTNTIGYQLRSNSSNLVASDTGYRYRLWLTSADGSKWVPINTSTSTNATTNRTLNTRPIDPFGPIVYRSTNGTCSAGTGIGATAIWQQYTLTIGYSYMASGFALTAQDAVYLRCTPQADGSAVMQDIVQTLPTSKDGKIYIHLGTAYSTTGMELTIEHAVYWHDGTGIRLWTGAESGGGSTVTVTQTLTSGTEIASVSVDGTATKLYAPTYTLPTASTSTLGGVKVDGTTITIANGVISSSGGGGGVSYTTQAVSIPSSAWSGTTATVSASAVTASNDIIVSPAPASVTAWASAGVYCSAQGAGTMTLTCTTAPTSSLTANVMAFEGGANVLPHSIINDGGICRSITLDGSYGVGVTDKEAEAMPSDVVTIAVTAITPYVYDADGNELPTTQVDSYEAGGSTRPPVPATVYLVFSFTMPNSEATIYGFPQ